MTRTNPCPCARSATLAAALALASAAQAQDVNLRATLSGGDVISATESPATGEVAAVLGDDDDLRIDVVFAGLELGATGAALHIGKYNENGPSVAELDIDTGETGGRIDGAELSLTGNVADDVRIGESYITITTIDYPDGAIRGQLMPQPVRLDDAPDEPVDVPSPPAPPSESAPLDEPPPEEAQTFDDDEPDPDALDADEQGDDVQDDDEADDTGQDEDGDLRQV